MNMLEVKEGEKAGGRGKTLEAAEKNVRTVLYRRSPRRPVHLIKH
jgi:hypothetical protein